MYTLNKMLVLSFLNILNVIFILNHKIKYLSNTIQLNPIYPVNNFQINQIVEYYLVTMMLSRNETNFLKIIPRT